MNNTQGPSPRPVQKSPRSESKPPLTEREVARRLREEQQRERMKLPTEAFLEELEAQEQPREIGREVLEETGKDEEDRERRLRRVRERDRGRGAREQQEQVPQEGEVGEPVSKQEPSEAQVPEQAREGTVPEGTPASRAAQLRELRLAGRTGSVAARAEGAAQTAQQAVRAARAAAAAARAVAVAAQAAVGVFQAIVATAPIWGPIVLIVLGIGLLILLVVILAGAACDAGFIARIGAKVLSGLECPQ